MKKTRAVLATAAATTLFAASAASAAPGPNYNSAGYWGPDCTKLSEPSQGAGGQVWFADQNYALVIVKGGSVDYGYGPGNRIWEDVMPGDALMAPLNHGGQQAAISHIIVCDPGGGYET